MFTEERQSAIEKCLRENGKVKVKELSEMFQVTEDCIRKDLKILENVGKLKRTYGGAILSQDYPLKRDEKSPIPVPLSSLTSLEPPL